MLLIIILPVCIQIRNLLEKSDMGTTDWLSVVPTHSQYSSYLEQCLVAWWIFHKATSVFEELIPSIKFYIFYFCFCFGGIVVSLNPFFRKIYKLLYLLWMMVWPPQLLRVSKCVLRNVLFTVLSAVIQVFNLDGVGKIGMSLCLVAF